MLDFMAQAIPASASMTNGVSLTQTFNLNC